MKKLIGMKRNFSSLENKKINRNDLKAVQGANSYDISENATCYDKKTYNDKCVLINTLYIGDNCGGL
ncbi:TIGR04139 family peptide modification target [Chryseobacterium sp. Marseille-Q3244]|uniref:TIGR04139 family peptide modification target n=1 Tax=Chryseobacterium sp. Marseille-Q3244 TaxID=2758092 RepID=UPI0020254DBF|nr:TIGR04139 family peptide modification target [Chryseobacterium sp. Marseille-Q3244]